MAADVCERLGQRIRRLRKERGWTQTDLAVHTGLGRQFISGVENGRHEPGIRAVEVFAQGFDLSLSELLRRL